MDALTEIYSQNAKAILYHVNTLLISKEEAEDAVQEVALEILKGIQGLKSPYAFKSWMYRIIFAICCRRNKKKDGEVKTVDIEDFMDVIADEKKNSSPEQAFEQSAAEREIARAVGELPEKQRLTVYMHYYESMSYKEIASALGMTVNAVGVNITKAKKSLRRALAPYEEQDGRDSRAKNLLKNAAMAGILGRHLDEVVSNSAKEAFVQKARFLAGQSPAPAGGAAAPAGYQAASFAKFWAIGAVCAVAVAIAVVLVLGRTPQPAEVAETPPLAAETGAYIPDAEIIMLDREDVSSFINPISARLEVAGGASLGWMIRGSDEAVLYAGESVLVDRDVLAELPKGDYVLEWIVKEDSTGYTAKVHKRIEITAEVSSEGR
ncbi:MAG: sigma-70 family RNA polymerase sigma factor [Clostridiales Family XIII bacterium]|nr:sigma-70 family RNA polymerase sigma factor [Clostridiales Family XIII bacterium]